jgi:hypothetical protein
LPFATASPLPASGAANLLRREQLPPRLSLQEEHSPPHPHLRHRLQLRLCQPRLLFRRLSIVAMKSAVAAVMPLLLPHSPPLSLPLPARSCQGLGFYSVYTCCYNLLQFLPGRLT